MNDLEIIRSRALEAETHQYDPNSFEDNSLADRLQQLAADVFCLTDMWSELRNKFYDSGLSGDTYVGQQMTAIETKYLSDSEGK